MQPTSSSQNVNSPNRAVSAASGSTLTRTGKRFTILKIVAALLIPPLGLIMAIMASVNKKQPKRAQSAVMLLVATAIGVLGYLTIFTGVINVNLIDRTKYSYQDTGANGFSTVQAAGMTFSKPTQFTSTAKKSGPNYSTESFAHFSPLKYPLGYIFTFSYKDSHTNDQKYVKGVNDFMSGTVKNSYSTQYINAIKKQVFDSYPQYSAKLGEPQKFTNANIKKNAWSFDLDILSTNPQIRPMQGKLVYALGNGRIYYFALMVTKDNWTPNMATWQTMLDSLKLGE